jgi:hypothetical protein
MQLNFRSHAKVWLNLGIAGSLLAITAATWSTTSRAAFAQPAKRKITAADVARIEQALRGTDPRTYRLVLPVFTAGEVTGSRTYGTLPLAQVRLVASARRAVVPEGGNLQLVMDPNAAGESRGARTNDSNDQKTDGPSTGGGANSHQSTSTKRLALMIEEIMKNIDTGQYVFLKPVTTALPKGRTGLPTTTPKAGPK